MYRQRYSKYGSTKTVYNGRRYDSKFEARTAQELDLRMKAGEFTEVEPQHRIKLYCYLPNGEKAFLFDYIVDFKCTKPDGSYLLVESKGVVTQLYRTKRKLLDMVWLPDHPEYEFEEVRLTSWRNTRNNV